MPLDPQEIFPEGICETNNIYYSSSFITKYNALCKERYCFMNFIYFSSRIANSLGPLVALLAPNLSKINDRDIEQTLNSQWLIKSVIWLKKYLKIIQFFSHSLFIFFSNI